MPHRLSVVTGEHPAADAGTPGPHARPATASSDASEPTSMRRPLPTPWSPDLSTRMLIRPGAWNAARYVVRMFPAGGILIRMPLASFEPGRVLRAAGDFLRPAGWRGLTPDERGLEGCLLFPRDKRVTSFDGTQIAYSVFGSRGPWVALVPGFCCPDNFWRYLLPELRKRYRVIVYDLRGLGLSGLPRRAGRRARSLSADDFTIENHVRDLEAVL